MKDITSDEQLIHFFVETRQPLYFDKLYRRYYSKVLRMCHAFAETSFEAEDMTQEIFVRVLTRVHTFSGRAQFSTWLYALTRNYCTDRLRLMTKNTQRLTDYVADLATAEEPFDSFTTYSRTDEQVYFLGIALTSLQPDEQELLNRKYEQMLAIEEIAKLEKRNLSAVKMRLLRARKRLRQAYEHTVQRHD